MSLRFTEEEYNNLIQQRQKNNRRSQQEEQWMIHYLSNQKQNIPSPDANTIKKESIANRNRNSLQKGQAFEGLILLQCKEYQKHGIAVIDKTPEPFLVLKRDKTGLFSGRFTNAKAQPDFQGTLQNGRSVILEAKATSKDRILTTVLTDTQIQLLANHHEMGALCGVLCEIQDNRFAVPYDIWIKAKKLYGHKYFTVAELIEQGCHVTTGLFDFLPVLTNKQ